MSTIMYKSTLFLFLLLCSLIGNSQNVQFNDPDLLTYLTTRSCVDTDGDGVFDSDADFNNDGQIQLSEAQQVVSFTFSTLAHNIQDIGGFENFSNLEYLNVTTISIDYLDLSVWPSLLSLGLSSTYIDTYVFDNPLLTEFQLQNVSFNNPVFDLTNLPSLEYVRIQSYNLTDNLIFGTHNNLEELRIYGGTYSTLNLLGMPALKYLTIDEFVGSSLDISNSILLEEFGFRYTDAMSTIVGADASSSLKLLDFIQDGYASSPSNLDLAFNNQALFDVSIRGLKSITINNNQSNDTADVDLYFIDDFVTITNSNFSDVDSFSGGSIEINYLNSDQITLSNIEESLSFLKFHDVISNQTLDLSTVQTEGITFSDSSFPELNLKNGNALQQFQSDYDTDIQFICVDSDELSIVQNGYDNITSPAVIHPYCTFILGGDYFEITGDVLVDLGSGCAETNGSVFNLQFTVTDGLSTDMFYADNINTYLYTLPEGSHTLSSELIDLDYWTVSPSSISLDFPLDGSPYVQDFCVTPIGVFNDVEVTLLPITTAVPGFESTYKLVYKNKGTTTLTGSIDFEINDELMDLVAATPTVATQTLGYLTWDYVNLLPFETREINISMLLNTPTDPVFPLNSDDVLVFSASINPIGSDQTPNNNLFTLEQTVVNALDPNDIRCLQGDTIPLEAVDEFVEYIIRFENNGTSNAVNVVVKDVLDSTKFDVTTVVPIDASHDFYTRINNGNEVEFIFENIQLPFDDATNDGYVLFKVKTLPTLMVGDSFSNEAEIYFDFNAPIITNTAVTTVVEENLSITAFNADDFLIFPNPTSGVLYLNSKTHMTSISIYDCNGRVLQSLPLGLNTLDYTLDVNDLSVGIYFLEVSSNTGIHKTKFVKK